MSKIFKLTLTVLMCAGSVFVQALSVGDIAVETALNQPLKAAIGLRNIGTTSVDEIEVRLGKPADFERADIEYLNFLRDLRFKVVPVGASSAKVHVTSNRPIREPYVNFLVVITWPSGQVLKEYAVLLDPVFGDTSLRSNTGSIAAQVEQTVRLSPNYSAPTAALRAPRVSRLTRSNDTASSVTVLAKDTLWNIAKQLAPTGVSVHQLMHAIKAANPNAFINNNINGLKAGYQLTIPSVNALQEISPQQAVSATRRDTARWRGAAEATASRSSAVSTRPAGELQLAAADDNKGAVAASEQFDALSSQNDELLDRVGSLEEQIEDLNRLLELKNKQLALLQQQAQDGGEGIALTASDDGVDTAVVSVETLEAPDEVDSSEFDLNVPADLDAPVEANVAAALAENQPLKTASPTDFEPTLEWWQRKPTQLAGLGGISVLLLGVLWLRRSRDEEEVLFVEDEDLVLGASNEDGEHIPLLDANVELDDEDAFDELENLSAQFKNQDYDLAIVNLETRVAEEAHRADLRLLLLQKCSEAGDKDRFVEHYRYLEAIAKPENLQIAERILKASQGSTAWLGGSDGDDDDFFKETVEAELSNEMEALLSATEGQSSLDEVGFESIDGGDIDELFLTDEAEEHGLDEALAEPTELEEAEDLDFNIDLEAITFGDDEPDLEESSIDDLAGIDDDLSFDPGELEDSTGENAAENGDDVLADIDAIDFGSGSQMLSEEVIVGDRDEADDIFDVTEAAGLDLEHEGSDDADDFGDFSGFLDSADEASIAGEDEVATKLELGEAFIEMGDADGAHEILTEVLEQGDVVQQAAARALLDKLDS